MKSFVLGLRAIYEIRSLSSHEIQEELSSSTKDIEAWEKRFTQQLYDSKLGYPHCEVFGTPILEDQLCRIAESSNLRFYLRRRDTKPTLCLTHDIDYLRVTWQLRVKRLVGYRRWPKAKESYLRSIQKLLEINRSVAGEGHSTVFVAAIVRPREMLGARAKSILIDPSYDLHDVEFEQLLKLFHSHQCEVGLHGGFYSLQSGLIEKEVKKLSIRTQSPIFSGRQHWLNLPDREQAFTSIRSSGLANDSTLGWNGVVGFRGGFSRPFYLQAGEKAYVREVPMLLMDGALFDDLRLNRQEAVSVAKKHLSEVKSRGGCAALNWHDRSASPHYGWAPAYEEIINWAFNEGFAFATVNQAANEFLPRVEAEQ